MGGELWWASSGEVPGQKNRDGYIVSVFIVLMEDGKYTIIPGLLGCRKPVSYQRV